MDEASSKFVDRLVMEKLLEEKLRKVRHSPEGGLDDPASLGQALATVSAGTSPTISETEDGFRFASPFPSGHPENDHCEVIVHRSEDRRGAIVFLHGLFEESRGIYDFLFRNLLRMGFDIYQSTLPYHYSRKPSSSSFGGEFFWSANFLRTSAAFRQAVCELHLLERIVAQRAEHPPLVCGFSMGGCVSLLLASLREDLHGVFAINPASTLSGIVWDSPLCSTIKADFLAAGRSAEELRSAFARFEPAGVERPALATERIHLCYGVYDQVTSLEQYESFARAWNLAGTTALKAGHMNTLRAPRLAGDIAGFHDSIPRLAARSPVP